METKRRQLLDGVARSRETVRLYMRKHARVHIERLLRHRAKYIIRIGSVLGLFSNLDVHAKMFWGRKLILPLRDADSFSLYFFGILGDLEYKLTRFLIKNLRPDDVFYDIGANLGFYTYLAQELISDGEIHAFEPLPSIFSYLERNSQNKRGIFLNNLALSDKSGTIPFFDGSPGRHSGGSTTLEAIAKTDLKKFRKIEVKAATLQDYVKSHAAPTVMKIDAEGGEAKVIQGGINVFKESRPTVVMEIWNGDKHQISMKAVEALQDAGYKEVCRINEEGDLENIPSDDFFPPPFHNLRHDNFIFLK